MPGTDGFTVVKELKASKQFCDLPVIMLTSDTSTDTEVELVRSGADVFLAKHQDPRVLCAHVQRLLDQRRKRQAA